MSEQNEVSTSVSPDNASITQVPIPISNLVSAKPAPAAGHVGDTGGTGGTCGPLLVSQFEYWILSDVDIVKPPKNDPPSAPMLITAIKDADQVTRLYARAFDTDLMQSWRILIDPGKNFVKLLNTGNQECAIIPNGLPDDDVQVVTAVVYDCPDYAFWYFLPTSDRDSATGAFSTYLISSSSNKHITVSLNQPDSTEIVQFSTYTKESVWKFVPVQPPQKKD